ncbi:MULTISPECIES: glycosyltransferase family 2 protein [Tenacibaculum]|uniref:glycosyltransferase family 2 protein n=1 Tax=Tenacibaculum TaxID=104267 RepID=UPI001F0A62D8|nr:MULTISPECIES: glycosyltransferase family 2 protein [Tenacibaculum]MCH3881558.1 glycosyltransferase family 2 protein [Tenacibaculum aquimarinum]MDO6598847.1 glycosyltransferase family 2 protein [Tenacibaculum sp. 1_MG-2023]
MNFKEFKHKYLKVPIEEYPNNREGKTALVTIKVITYNHAKFIKECLDAILMQETNFDFEILIAEDQSNDGTREICIEYAKKHPDRIRLLLNSRENNIPINGNPSGTFNSVYANFSIHSKYITMIEGDDYWTDKHSLQKRVDFLEKNKEYVLCFHNAKIYHQSSHKFHDKFKSPFFKSVSLEKHQILNSNITTLTLLYRNGLVDVFDEKMTNIISGDTILRGKLANFGKARYIHEIKPSVYRVHAGGISYEKSFKEIKEGALNARFYLLDHYKKKKWDVNPVNESLAVYYFWFFLIQLKKDKKVTIGYLFKGLHYSRKSKTSLFSIFKYALNNRKRKIVNY